MARVTRPGGRVAVCMWDIAGGGMTMLRVFWTAMKAVRPETEDESGPGRHLGGRHRRAS